MAALGDACVTHGAPCVVLLVPGVAACSQVKSKVLTAAACVCLHFLFDEVADGGGML
jgi:hypothetical protein